MKIIIIDGVEYNLTPKAQFKKGDWLVENEPNNYARFVQILDIVNVQGKERYRISRDIHNDEDVVECDFVESYYHLFTLTDVKNGDVLVHDDCICIFKRMKPYHYDLFDTHCELYGGHHFGIGFDFNIRGFHPATKEERTLLFEKMREAGYKWLAEKKELRKIEQSNDYSNANVSQKDFALPPQSERKSLQQVFNDFQNDMDYFIRYAEAWVKEQNKNEKKQSTEWSEKDKTMLNDVISLIENSGHVSDIKKHYVSWLEELKDRFVPKQNGTS